jgi:TonB family protein
MNALHAIAVITVVVLTGCATSPNEPASKDLMLPTLSQTGGDPSGDLMEIVMSQIRYPSQAVMEGIEGTVVVGFDVLPSGEIDNVKLIRSSASRLLDREAIRAVNAVRTKGTRITCRPESKITVQAPITFSLRQ